MKYLLIEADVYGANALSNHHVIGIPSLTSFDGFIKNIFLKSGLSPLDIDCFWVGIRDQNIKIGQNKISNNTKGAKSDKILNPPISEISKSLNFKMSLIVKFTIDGESNLKESKMKNVITDGGLVLSGGALFNLDAMFKDDLISALKEIPMNTYILSDESYLLDDEHMSKVDKFIDLIRKEKNTSNKVYKDWYTPINIGFKLLEEPTNRDSFIRGVFNNKNELKKYEHAFSEPITGVVKAVSKIKFISEILSSNKCDTYNYGLQGYYDEKQKIYVVKNKSKIEEK